MGRLDEKVAVVTGGASGIGEATVRRFVEEGALVVVADIQDDLGEGLVAEVGDGAVYVHTDVTVEDDVRAAVDLAVSHFGGIDCMYNNAGLVGPLGSITQTSYDAWQRTIAVLLSSVFLGIKHAGAAMIEQGRGGSIISTSSTAGIMGGLGPHVYTAAKHGVIGLSKSAANELAPHRIRVNAISPGGTVTPLIAGVVAGDQAAIAAAEAALTRNSFLGYATLASDIANAALYLAADESRCVTGHTLVVDQGSVTAGSAVNPFHTRTG